MTLPSLGHVTCEGLGLCGDWGLYGDWITFEPEQIRRDRLVLQATSFRN